MEGEPTPIQTPEAEARALYGHIFGARRKSVPYSYYLMQIVGAKSSKSNKSILLLRYVVDLESLAPMGTRVSQYLTPAELFQELETHNAIDLGKYIRIDEEALTEASRKLRAYFSEKAPAPETDQ